MSNIEMKRWMRLCERTDPVTGEYYPSPGEEMEDEYVSDRFKEETRPVHVAFEEGSVCHYLFTVSAMTGIGSSERKFIIMNGLEPFLKQYSLLRDERVEETFQVGDQFKNEGFAIIDKIENGTATEFEVKNRLKKEMDFLEQNIIDKDDYDATQGAEHRQLYREPPPG